MKIEITIESEVTGERIFHAECLSVESAIQELYRFERNQEKLMDVREDSV